MNNSIKTMFKHTFLKKKFLKLISALSFRSHPMVFYPFLLVLTACSQNPTQSLIDSQAPVEHHKAQSTSHPVIEQALTTQKSNPDSKTAYTIENLQDRMINGYQLNVDEHQHPDIERYITWLKKHPEHVSHLCENAQTHLHYIVEMLDEKGLPLELALLPAIESTYDPLATSESGAKGLWQIMPATARYLHVPLDGVFDGRQDLHLSTHAALNYLSSMNQQFNGNWLHTIAAYNGGPGTLRRAIKNNLKQGKKTDFWSLNLPQQTKNYVPKLLALAKVFANPELYNSKSCKIKNQPLLHRAKLKYQTDLYTIAKLAKLPLSDLIKLNPALKHAITPLNGPHFVFIPIRIAKAFQESEKKLSKQNRITFVEHTIASGDTLSGIAKKYKTPYKNIMHFNNLSSTHLRLGKTLKIPKQPTRVTPPKSNLKKVIYQVKQGDTWWKIAKQFGVRHHQLATWNNQSSSDKLKVGRRLIIWPNS